MINKQMYECPKCSAYFPILAIQLSINKNRGFCCKMCCPRDVHRQCESLEYQLKPRESGAGYDEIQVRGSYTNSFWLHGFELDLYFVFWQSLKDKLRKQLSTSDGAAPHDGIYNLLHALEGKPLPSNLPSDLMELGIHPSAMAGHRGRTAGGGWPGRFKGGGT